MKAIIILGLSFIIGWCSVYTQLVNDTTYIPCENFNFKIDTTWEIKFGMEKMPERALDINNKKKR